MTLAQIYAQHGIPADTDPAHAAEMLDGKARAIKDQLRTVAPSFYAEEIAWKPKEMKVTEAIDPSLDAIKATVSGKSLTELRTVRDEIAAMSAQLEGATRRITAQFGQDDVQAGLVRLARHRKELAFLDLLIEDLAA